MEISISGTPVSRKEEGEKYWFKGTKMQFSKIQNKGKYKNYPARAKRRYFFTCPRYISTLLSYLQWVSFCAFLHLHFYNNLNESKDYIKIYNRNLLQEEANKATLNLAGNK